MADPRVPFKKFGKCEQKNISTHDKPETSDFETEDVTTESDISADDEDSYEYSDVPPDDNSGNCLGSASQDVGLSKDDKVNVDVEDSTDKPEIKMEESSDNQTSLADSDDEFLCSRDVTTTPKEIESQDIYIDDEITESESLFLADSCNVGCCCYDCIAEGNIDVYECEAAVPCYDFLAGDAFHDSNWYPETDLQYKDCYEVYDDGYEENCGD